PRRRWLHERISDRPAVARRAGHPHLRRHQRNHEGAGCPLDL
ncbi:MAG: Acyl-CoA dehydrogenase, partial [uncultured Sphingomonas sp.]